MLLAVTAGVWLVGSIAACGLIVTTSQFSRRLDYFWLVAWSLLWPAFIVSALYFAWQAWREQAK